MIQSQDDLEQWYQNDDPWDYETSLDDVKRRDIFLAELPDRPYKKVLDIGCGHGYLTREIPGDKIIGVDLSQKGIEQAKKLGKKKGKDISYKVGNLFDLLDLFPKQKFDLIVVTGVLYPQYIADSHSLVYSIIDTLLADKGILASVHIAEWYKSQFPYPKITTKLYNYRDYMHLLEIYGKI